MSLGSPRLVSLSIIRIYMAEGWGPEGFLRYKAFNEVKGVEHGPRRTL